MAEMTIDQALALAQSHHQAGRLREAEGLYRQILQHEPRCVEAVHLLGSLAGQVGQFAAAEQVLRQAIALKGDYAPSWNNLGNALLHQNRLDEAAAAYARAIEFQPDYADAYNNTGNVLRRSGKQHEAIESYRRAVELMPNLFSALVNLGNAMHEQGNFAEAVQYCRRAIEVRPGEGRVWNNLGNALDEMGRTDEAIEAFERAITLSPDFADAHGNYGSALHHAGRACEAIPRFRRSLELNPRNATIHSNMLYTMHFCRDFSPADLLAEHRQWAKAHTSDVIPLTPQPSRDPDRCLRIGYISPDLRRHPIGRFLLPLLENHDRTQFEIVAFSGADRADATTERFREVAGRWHETKSLNDDQLADLIRRDEIDILIDLSLHSSQNRLLVFARKPAPIQVTYLAYASTSGLSTMDYRLTDEFLDPPGEERNYVEQSIRLKTYWCYGPMGSEGAVAPLPAKAAGSVTFGCLNSVSKWRDEALASWAKVLDAVPGSKLLLLAPAGKLRQRATDALGVDRVEFAELAYFEAYMANYHRIDIALDPFPFAGGTTTCDAMWMGVPVVTLAGETAVGRGGASLLNQVGLGELVARTTDDYVRIAAELAQDLPRLEDMRSSLREWMSASPLCDTKAHARDIESHYRSMWHRWCSSQ